MKKVLLSAFAALACVATASADEVTYDFVNNTYGMTRLSGTTSEYNPDPFTVEGDGMVTIDLVGGTRLWSDGLRFYKNSSYSINVNGGEMTKIVINYKNDAAGNGFDFKEGQAGTYTLESKVGTWEGSSSAVSFSCNIAKSNVAISSITVTYTGGTQDTRKDAGLEFSDEKVSAVLGEAFTAPDLTKATNAPVTFSSDKETVATVDAATGAVTIVGVGTARITATAEANEEYKAGSASYLLTVTKPVVTKPVELATAMSDGKFVIYTPQGVAKNYTGSNAYGYLFLESVTPADNKFDVNEDYFIEFTATANGYTMKDIRGKYLGMDATHFGSFNFYDTPDAEGSNCYWTVTFSGTDVKIENTGRAGAYISYKQYNEDWELTTTDTADQPLVNLYKEAGTSSIEETVADENAPVEYFNLQGIRVNNPENGLYIRRQGNTVTKVIR